MHNGDNSTFSQYNSDICIQSVKFYYNQDNIVFDNLNFTIKKKEVTAIVGSTGIGKTSLVKLLLRLYEPQNGNILIGSENIKNLKLKDLRKSIGLVSQDTFLFDGSIKDNIIYPEQTLDFDRMKPHFRFLCIYNGMQELD